MVSRKKKIFVLIRHEENFAEVTFTAKLSLKAIPRKTEICLICQCEEIIFGNFQHGKSIVEVISFLFPDEGLCSYSWNDQEMQIKEVLRECFPQRDLEFRSIDETENFGWTRDICEVQSFQY